MVLVSIDEVPYMCGSLKLVINFLSLNPAAAGHDLAFTYSL